MNRFAIRAVVLLAVAAIATAGIAGVAYAAWRGAAAFYWFEQWRRWRVSDPSGAELYQINWWLQILLALPGIGAVLLGGLILRHLALRK